MEILKKLSQTLKYFISNPFMMEITKKLSKQILKKNKGIKIKFLKFKIIIK
jgi:hypothetical protein